MRCVVGTRYLLHWSMVPTRGWNAERSAATETVSILTKRAGKGKSYKYFMINLNPRRGWLFSSRYETATCDGARISFRSSPSTSSGAVAVVWEVSIHGNTKPVNLQ